MNRIFCSAMRRHVIRYITRQSDLYRLLAFSLIFVFSVALSLASPAHAAGAIASIDGHGDKINGIVWNAPSMSAAKEAAVADCKKIAKREKVTGTCRPMVWGYGPGYLSIVYGKEGVGYAYGDTQQSAVDEAFDNCKKLGQGCQQDHINTWNDTVAGRDRVQSETRSERSTTRCINASCVRDYEDGRRIEFIACINPTTGAAFSNIDGSCGGVDSMGYVFGQHRE